jgi:hypothetical protein
MLHIVAFLAWVCVGYVVYLVLTPSITWLRCVIAELINATTCV